MHREPVEPRPRAHDSGTSVHITFGPFTLDGRSGELRRDNELIPLRPLATRALLLLVEHPGRLVKREDLRHALWGDTAVEWEAGVHQVISQLRNALRDDSRAPVFVETVPRRGYRFKAGMIAANAMAPSPPASFAARFHPWTFIGGAATSLGIVAALFFLCCGFLA